MTSALPDNEIDRLEKLCNYKILDSEPEQAFNQIAIEACHTFDTPIAIVSLVDKYRVWYKASIGLDGLQEVPREDSLCSLVVLQDAVTVFNDALQEPCLLANPFVAGDFGLQFFAGAPIITADGFRLGAVCVIDKKPRAISSEEKVILEKLALRAMHEINKRLFKLIS